MALTDAMNIVTGLL